TPRPGLHAVPWRARHRVVLVQSDRAPRILVCESENGHWSRLRERNPIPFSHARTWPAVFVLGRATFRALAGAAQFWARAAGPGDLDSRMRERKRTLVSPTRAKPDSVLV